MLLTALTLSVNVVLGLKPVILPLSPTGNYNGRVQLDLRQLPAGTAIPHKLYVFYNKMRERYQQDAFTVEIAYTTTIDLIVNALMS